MTKKNWLRISLWKVFPSVLWGSWLLYELWKSHHWLVLPQPCAALVLWLSNAQKYVSIFSKSQQTHPEWHMVLLFLLRQGLGIESRGSFWTYLPKNRTSLMNVTFSENMNFIPLCYWRKRVKQGFACASQSTQWLLLGIFVQEVFETNLNFKYQWVKNLKGKVTVLCQF